MYKRQDPYGPLLTFRVDKTCNVTITANVSRAGATGVVMEDPDEDPVVNLPETFLVEICAVPDECYVGMVDYAEWDIVGKPLCWCYPRQCLGDADGLVYGKLLHWVSIPDLTILKDAWSKAVTDPLWTSDMACADFDHAPVSYTHLTLPTTPYV